MENQTMSKEGYDKMNADRKAFVQKIIDSIEAGTPLWRKPWKTSGIEFSQINPTTKTEYGGINFMRLFIEAQERGFEDNRWVTFNQAKKEGWTIEKGAKSVPIYKWTEYDKLTKSNPDWDKIRALPRDEQKAYLEKNIQKGMCYAGAVFNGEQVKGIVNTADVPLEMAYMRLKRQKTFRALKTFKL